tara:strand:- start:996 stop:1190 length:195 start_codon:yes stop_codon:yes gene_type:complete
MARNNPEQFNYIVAYMGGREMEGVTEDWVPCKTMDEVVSTMDDIKETHGFWKLAVCQIIEEYES